MALPTSTNGTSSQTSMVPAEWPAQAADAVVDTISKVRDKTTKPALTAARALVYGIIVAVVGSVALVVALIGVIRAADNYLPGAIWSIYLGLSVIFGLTGIYLLRKANRPLPSAA